MLDWSLCGWRLVRVASFQCVYYLTDGDVCMLAHDLDVVEDGAVLLHRLADAVFERLKWYAQLEAVLHEALTSRVERQAVCDA